jgi:hypothetical protein
MRRVGLPRGDKTAAEIYHAVGLVSSEWEALEYVLAALFVRIIGGDEIPTYRAYGSIASFRGRHDVLLAAAAARFSPKSRTWLRIKELLNRKNSISTRRGEAVHRMVAGAWKRGSGISDQKTRRSA